MEKCYDLLVYVVGKLLETKQDGLEEKMWGESGEVKTIALINVKECTPVTVTCNPPKQLYWIKIPCVTIETKLY